MLTNQQQSSPWGSWQAYAGRRGLFLLILQKIHWKMAQNGACGFDGFSALVYHITV